MTMLIDFNERTFVWWLRKHHMSEFEKLVKQFMKYCIEETKIAHKNEEEQENLKQSD